MIRALLVLMALALPAHATQDAIPGLYDVTGVAADDVLNIRAAPDAGAEIIGTLAPDATGVEVVGLSDDLRWGRVNTDGRAGWTSMTFLVPRPGEWDGRIPEALSCSGTEPFWSLAIDGEAQVLDRIDRGELLFEGPGDRVPAEGRRDRWSLRNFEDGRSLTAVVVARACSDGMSDRAFGLATDVLLSTETGHTHLSGCCSLVP